MFPDLKDEDEEFIQHMVNSKYHILERKYDGTAAMIDIKDGCLTVWGRGLLKDGSQQNYTDKFPELRDEINNHFTMDCKILGEIVVLDEDGNESLTKLQSRMNRESDIEVYAEKYPTSFIAFDIKSLRDQDLSEYRFYDRRKILNDYLPRSYMVFLIQQWLTKRDKIFILDELKDKEFEGVVAKFINGKWGKEQYKYKPRLSQDVFWEGEFIPGKGKYDGLVGSLICYQYINGAKMQVAKVGGGMHMELRRQLTRLQPQVSKDNPRVIEVQTHELLKSGKLRYPQFIKFRTDKAPEQCIRKLALHPSSQSSGKTILDEWV